MSKDLDERLKRFDERNAPAVAAEHDSDRDAHIALLNMQELLLRTVAGAALSACETLEIDPQQAHGSIEPNHEKKKWEVKLNVSAIGLARTDHDTAKIQSVMAEAFTKASQTMAPTKETINVACALFEGRVRAENLGLGEDEVVKRIRRWAGKK